MSTTISTAFVAEYMSGVKLAYQRQGSKLRNLCRLKPNVVGSTEIFQKLGTGTATQKTRHGNVPAMNQTHSTVTATLADWYAGDYIGYLDEQKITFDEKQAIMKSGAYALGRKADGLIINAFDTSSTTHTAYVANTGFSKAQVMKAFETLNAADIPDDGDRYAAIGAHQWNELMNLTEFKSADYVGYSNQPFLMGTEVKNWMNIKWIMHTGLSMGATNLTLTNLGANCRCAYLWHKSAIGLAEGQEIHSQIDWVPEKAEHFADSWMSMGAITIEATGIITTYCDDTATTSLA
jgi:hypothetical protein